MKEIEKIISMMEQKNLKYSDLASYLGVGKSIVSAWKTRNTNPPLEYIVQICKFLNISLYELLDAEPTNNIEQLYNKLTPEDRAIVDNILSRYQEQESYTSKIG